MCYSFNFAAVQRSGGVEYHMRGCMFVSVWNIFAIVCLLKAVLSKEAVGLRSRFVTCSQLFAVGLMIIKPVTF